MKKRNLAAVAAGLLLAFLLSGCANTGIGPQLSSSTEDYNFHLTLSCEDAGLSWPRDGTTPLVYAGEDSEERISCSVSENDDGTIVLSGRLESGDKVSVRLPQLYQEEGLGEITQPVEKLGAPLPLEDGVEITFTRIDILPQTGSEEESMAVVHFETNAPERFQNSSGFAMRMDGETLQPATFSINSEDGGDLYFPLPAGETPANLAVVGAELVVSKIWNPVDKEEVSVSCEPAELTVTVLS